MTLGILIGTERGLYSLLPGEPARPLLRDVEVASVDAAEGRAVLAAPGSGVWLHDGGDPDQWRRIWEGDARCARLAADGSIYAGAAPTALVHSSDGGENWTPSTSLENVIRYHRSRLTSSSSASWALTSIAFPGESLLVAIDGGGVWMSGDEGKSWQPRSEGLDPAVGHVFEHPERHDRLFATTRSGLYRSDDGGFSWLQSISGLDRSVAMGLAVLAGAPDALVLSASRRPNGERGALFRSIDGGVRWIRFMLGDDDEWPRSPVVTRLPGSIDTSFVFAGGRVWASHDRGGDWRALTGPEDAARIPPATAIAVAL